MSIYMSRAELEEISEGLITAYANKYSYGHLFDDVQKSIANDLNMIRRGGI